MTRVLMVFSATRDNCAGQRRLPVTRDAATTFSITTATSGSGAGSFSGTRQNAGLSTAHVGVRQHRRRARLHSCTAIRMPRDAAIVPFDLRYNVTNLQYVPGAGRDAGRGAPVDLAAAGRSHPQGVPHVGAAGALTNIPVVYRQYPTPPTLVGQTWSDYTPSCRPAIRSPTAPTGGTLSPIRHSLPRRTRSTAQSPTTPISVRRRTSNSRACGHCSTTMLRSICSPPCAHLRGARSHPADPAQPDGSASGPTRSPHSPPRRRGREEQGLEPAAQLCLRGRAGQRHRQLRHHRHGAAEPDDAADRAAMAGGPGRIELCQCGAHRHGAGSGAAFRPIRSSNRSVASTRYAAVPGGRRARSADLASPIRSRSTGSMCWPRKMRWPRCRSSAT